MFSSSLFAWDVRFGGGTGLEKKGGARSEWEKELKEENRRKAHTNASQVAVAFFSSSLSELLLPP